MGFVGTCVCLHLHRGDLAIRPWCGARAAGDPPLHRAVKCGHVNMVHLLFSFGADVRGRNAEGLPPLCVAVRECRGLAKHKILDVLLRTPGAVALGCPVAPVRTTVALHLG